MPETPPKPKYAINCPPSCSFHPSKIGQKNANVLKSLREDGVGALVFARRATAILNRPVQTSSSGRHFAHYREIIEDEAPKEVIAKPSDLAILDAIITSGFQNSKSWRPTIKDTLDAMKLKVQMTGQSAFEDMITAMDSALDLADGVSDEEEDVIEAPEAIFSVGEAPEPEEVDE